MRGAPNTHTHTHTHKGGGGVQGIRGLMGGSEQGEEVPYLFFENNYALPSAKGTCLSYKMI